MDSFSFQPDRARTAALDRAIRGALADSVTTVLVQAARAGIAYAGDLDAWCQELLAQTRAAPGLWSGYHELMQAVVRADEAAVAAVASDLMARLPGPCGRPGTVLSIDEADLGARDAARYRAVVDNDPERPLDLMPASRAEVARIAALTVAARDLLSEADAVLLDEIDTLAHQVVLASGRARNFGGAATVFLWGAVVLNPALVPDRVTLIEALAHESAHALLFGLTLGVDLTTNDPAERHASPLRPDPRPIEGIVHATYVLARMTHALGQIRGAPSLTPAERALIDGKLARNRANYEAGLAVVDAYARFTPEGACIFVACRQAMEVGVGAKAAADPIAAL